MQEFPIRLWFKGNPGNIAMMYMAALKLKKTLGFGEVINTSIPIFDIELEDRQLAGRIGLHDTMRANLASRGLIPFHGYKDIVERSAAAFLSMEGFYQHVGNFLTASEMDYDDVFKADAQPEHGQADELVISIRGGEILDAIHQDYTLIPLEFYEFLIRTTGLKPVFFGQLGNNPYCESLRHRFPNARFKSGSNPRFDFNFLRKSVHIVPSVSTFSWLAAWLSRAEKIHLPLTGLLNPNQHKGSFLVPQEDHRYAFYLFPNNYALPVQRHAEYLAPIGDLWTSVSGQRLQETCARRPRTERDVEAYLRIFNETDYVQMYPEKAGLRDRFGLCGLVNDYLSDGFGQGRHPCRLDVSWYTRQYPVAGMDVANNFYHDEMHHYSEVGRMMGYLPVMPT